MALSRRTLRNLALVPVAIGAAMLVGAAFAFGHERSFLQRAETADATIVELVPRGTGSGGAHSTVYAPVYEFEDADGQVHTARSSVASDPPPGEVGEVIEVLYDPADPTDSLQNTFFARWGTTFVLASGGLGNVLFFGVAAGVLGRQLRRQRPRSEGAGDADDAHAAPR